VATYEYPAPVGAALSTYTHTLVILPEYDLVIERACAG
jgi:hypothetical protein